MQKAKDPEASFKKAYGEYYVGAYIIGASNSNNLSAATSISASSEGFDGQVKIKLLFFSVTKGFGHHESSFNSVSVASLSAYDTLDNWGENQTVSDLNGYNSVLEAAANNGQKSTTIAHRVAERIDKLGLCQGKDLPWSTCEALFRNGVVAELLLLPYARLRQYNEALLAGWARGTL